MIEKTFPYDCDRSLLGTALAARFRPLAPDEELDAFLSRVGAAPHGLLVTKLMELCGALASSYDVHGWFGAYPMHLLSTRAWGELLNGERRGSLLDVGAGAGYVSERARPWFDEIVCSETSPQLRRRLTRLGLQTVENDLTVSPLARRFAVVSCLNVLDRTERPLSLLRSLLSQLEPGGLLLVSIPLPAAPHVHVRGGTRAQSERLPSLAAHWELAARELSERMFMPLGLSIERLARLPYLSRGDAHAPLYVLDAALWVCTHPLPMPPRSEP